MICRASTFNSGGIEHLYKTPVTSPALALHAFLRPFGAEVAVAVSIRRLSARCSAPRRRPLRRDCGRRLSGTGKSGSDQCLILLQN